MLEGWAKKELQSLTWPARLVLIVPASVRRGMAESTAVPKNRASVACIAMSSLSLLPIESPGQIVPFSSAEAAQLLLHVMCEEWYLDSTY